MNIDALPAYYALEHELSRVPGDEPRADAARRADQRAGRRAWTGEPAARQRGRPLDPLPGRQCHDRPAAGALARSPTPFPDTRRKTSSPHAWTTRSSIATAMQTRIRLNSIAVNVRHVGDPSTAREVAVTYVKGGNTYQVRGAHCVLACWNSMIPYLCPDMPARQREALALRHQGADRLHQRPHPRLDVFQKLGVSNISAPGGYHSSVGLAEDGDDRRATRRRSRRTSRWCCTWSATPCAPGKPRKEQHRLGSEDLLRDDVRDVRTEHPRSARADARRRRLRSGARHRGDHGQPLAARLHLQLQHALRSGRVGARDARRSRACRRASAVRPDLDRQRRRRRQLAHRRRDRHGVPRGQRGDRVAIERVRLTHSEVGGMSTGPARASQRALLRSRRLPAAASAPPPLPWDKPKVPLVAVVGCAAASPEPHIWILSAPGRVPSPIIRRITAADRSRAGAATARAGHVSADRRRRFR